MEPSENIEVKSEAVQNAEETSEAAEIKTAVAQTADTDSPYEKKIKRKIDAIKSLYSTAAVLLLTAFLLNGVLSLHLVPTPSMYPTIDNPSLVVALRFPYLIGDPMPKYGDIVSFSVPQSENLLIKRVIGLPGDEIRFHGGYVYRNGEVQVEDYVAEQGMTFYNCRNNTEDDYDDSVFVVPEGSVFLLGDNRMHSADCRVLTPSYVPVENLYAKMLFGFRIPSSLYEHEEIQNT